MEECQKYTTAIFQQVFCLVGFDFYCLSDFIAKNRHEGLGIKNSSLPYATGLLVLAELLRWNPSKPVFRLECSRKVLLF